MSPIEVNKVQEGWRSVFVEQEFVTPEQAKSITQKALWQILIPSLLFHI